jgi:hypothetical protein
VTPLSYRDAAGIRHEIVVSKTAAGDWQVLDTCSDESRMMETLDGREDDEPQAEAVARDFLSAGRFNTPAGQRPAEAIPEQRGADASSDPRPRPPAHQPRARGIALPHPAG